MFTKGLPKELSSNKRFETKREIVVKYVAEFGFSSVDVLSALVGLKAKDNAFFMKRLFETDVLVRFSNRTFSKKDLVRLGVAGWFLHCDDQLPRTNIRNDIWEKHSRLRHDLAVQKVVLKKLHNFSEVIADYDIKHEEFKKLRPDAICFFNNREKKKPVAIEYELTRKSPRDTFALFNRYLDKCADGAYSLVLFVFDDPVDAAKYKERFDQEYWPRWLEAKNMDGKEYWKKEKNGRHVPTDNAFRGFFRFQVMGADDEPTLVKNERESYTGESLIQYFYDRKEVEEEEVEEEEVEEVEEVEEEEEEEEDFPVVINAAPVKEDVPKKSFWSRLNL